VKKKKAIPRAKSERGSGEQIGAERERKRKRESDEDAPIRTGERKTRRDVSNRQRKRGKSERNV